MTFNRSSRARRKGFTIIEILIVIALLAGIFGLVIVRMDNVLGTNQEKIAEMWVNNSVKTPLVAYRTSVGRYPSTEQGLQALISAPSGVKDWKGPYLEDREVPLDPWKNPYQYRYPGTQNPDSYDVWSLGPDGQPSDDDIGNW